MLSKLLLCPLFHTNDNWSKDGRRCSRPKDTQDADVTVVTQDADVYRVINNLQILINVFIAIKSKQLQRCVSNYRLFQTNLMRHS